MELDIFDSNQPTRVNWAMMQINATGHNRLENEMFPSFLASHLILSLNQNIIFFLVNFFWKYFKLENLFSFPRFDKKYRVIFFKRSMIKDSSFEIIEEKKKNQSLSSLFFDRIN